MAEGAPASAYRRSVKNYFLNLRYQLKFTLTMVGVALTLTAGLGYIVMSKVWESSRLALQQLDSSDAQVVANMAADDRLLLYTLIGFAIILSVVLSVYGIVMTHKVAGPLHKVSLHLDKIRDGKLGVVYDLRKGDELVDFFEHFKNAHDALRHRTEADIALLDQVIQVIQVIQATQATQGLAAAPATEALKAELAAARKAKADSLV